MAYMFYYDLGGTLGQDKTGNQTAVGGEMLTGIGAADGGYWSGTEFDSSEAWIFGLGNGNQNPDFKTILHSTWAVRDGDVPEPASLLLIGLGLAGLGFSRRSRAS